jgi:hypothetical protein
MCGLIHKRLDHLHPLRIQKFSERFCFLGKNACIIQCCPDCYSEPRSYSPWSRSVAQNSSSKVKKKETKKKKNRTERKKSKERFFSHTFSLLCSQNFFFWWRRFFLFPFSLSFYRFCATIIRDDS